MKRYLEGKVVVVTGASSGIGEAMAREYAKMGAKVVMAARREEELQCIAAEIRQSGGEVTYSACDVVSEDDCKRLMERAVEAYGGIDVLICNAGLSMRALFDDCDLKVLHRLMDVNFWYGKLHEVCLAVASEVARLTCWHLLCCGYSRLARTYGILGIEVRNDGILGYDTC